MNIKLSITTALISILGLTACSSTSLGLGSGTSINTYGQVCISNGAKVNLHDLIKKVSNNSNSNYEFKNEYNSYSTSYVTFKDNRCFSNINDLKSYIDTYTSYTLEINKQKSTSSNNVVKNEGIFLDRVYIQDVIDYFNLVNGTKVKYFDDNILLKDNFRRLYTIDELSKYINDTTPFTLVLSKTSSGSSFYKLNYKSHISYSRDDEVVANLEKAKKSAESISNKDLAKKIDEVLVEFKSIN